MQLLKPRLRLTDSLAVIETSLTFDFVEKGVVNCLHSRKTEIERHIRDRVDGAVFLHAMQLVENSTASGSKTSARLLGGTLSVGITRSSASST